MFPARLRKTRWLILAVVPLVLYLVLDNHLSWRPRRLPAATYGGVKHLAFLPDNKTLLVIGYSRSSMIDDVALWDTQRRRVLHKMTLDSVLALTSSGEKLIAVKYDSDIEKGLDMNVLNTRTGVILRTLNLGRDYDGENDGEFTFWPDDNTLTSVGEHGLKQWDVRTEKVKRVLPNIRGDQYAISPDGMTLALKNIWRRGDERSSGSRDLYQLEVWNLRTGKHWSRPDRRVENDHLVFSRDGSVLAKITDCYGVALLNPATGRLMRSLFPASHTSANACQQPYYLNALALSPDAKTLAVGGNYAGQDFVKLWNTQTGQEQRTIRQYEMGPLEEGAEEGVKALAFTPDGKTLASGHDDGRINLWRIK